MNTKKLRLTAGVLAVIAFSNHANAQSTSYNVNSIPVGGSASCAFGVGALNSTTGIANVGMGYEALYSNTSGSYNSAFGYQALYVNTGSENTALGFRAMKNNSTGTHNTASGMNALYTNATGSNNTASGYQALYGNLYGSNNCATGYNALYSMTNGYDNVVEGHTAMYNSTTASYNVALGSQTLYSNLTGNYNVALGYQALYVNTASENTALGFRALKNNSTGGYNTGSGTNALYTTATGSYNSAHGHNALYTNIYGSNNSALGYNADVSGNSLSNAMVLGANAVVNNNNKVRIGNTSVTVIEGQVAYTWPSDARFKENVTEEVKGLEFIKLLRPVVYNFNTRKFEEFLTKNMTPEMQKEHLEGVDFGPSTAIRQSGFLAQEVEKAAKQVGYDFNGIHVPENDNDNYSLAYAEFVVPLVKGMQEQQTMIEEQKELLEAQQAMIAQLQQQLNDLQKSIQSGNNTGINTTSLSGVSMEQNVPNPFSHETVIKFNLPQEINNAYMAVYDLTGKQLKKITLNERGTSSITITGDDLSAGMYIYTIIADGTAVSSKRMVVSEK